MGGNVKVQLTEAQLKRLSPALREACKTNENLNIGIAQALNKRGLSYEQVNAYYENDIVVKGMIVEREDDGSVRPPAESTIGKLGEDKDFREITTAQWETYFRERYTQNLGEAKHDIVRLLAHKEVKQVQGSYRELWNYTDTADPDKRDASMRLRMKYVNSHPEKLQELDLVAAKFIEDNKDKLDDPNLISEFRAAFAPKTQTEQGQTNTQNIVIEKLTMDDLKALAQFKALNEVTAVGSGMTEDEVAMASEEMAIQTIEDKELNTSLVKVHDYQTQIAQIRNKHRNDPAIKALTDKYMSDRLALEAQLKDADETKKADIQRQISELKAKFEQDCDAQLPEKERKKITKLQKDIAKAKTESVEKEKKFVEKNMDKLVKLAATTQVQIDMQKHKYDSTPAPEFATLDKSVQELVKGNPALFCDEITDPADTRTPTVEFGGKKYVYSPQKFKAQMLEFSHAGKSAGVEQANQEGYDYFCDLPEMDAAFKGIKFGGLGDDQEEKRGVMKKAMKAAGITTEPDHTAQKIVAKILKAGVVGFGTAVGGLLLADTMATLRTCPFTEKIYELAALTKMIPYSGDDATWSYSGKHHYKGEQGWHYEDDVTVSGNADWSFSKDYDLNGETDWHFTKDYFLEGNDASWTGNYDWVFDDEVIVNHEHNGIIIDTKTIPVHGEGSGTISGNDGYWSTTHTVDEHGTTTWTFTHHVEESGSVPYTQTVHITKDGVVTYEGDVDVNVSGNNGHYEGEVANPDADRELYEQTGEKTHKLRPQFHSLGDYAKVGAGGALLAMGGKALDIIFNTKKYRDQGLRKPAEANRVISQKEIRKKPELPNPPKPDNDEDEEEDDFCSNVQLISEGVPEVAGTDDEDVVKIKMNEKGNVIFWHQTAEAYDIPQGLTAKDVYWVIRELNGDPQHNKYAPDEVGLPIEIEVKGIKVRRKDAFEIKGRNYKPTGKGKKGVGKGTTYQGYKGTPGTPGKDANYGIFNCADNSLISDGYTSEAAAEEARSNLKKK